MAKKGFPQPPADEPADWITSYADLMSLLACFFMLMMAFANYDTPGVQAKAKIIAETFNKKDGATSELDIEKLKNEIAHHPDFKERTKITLKDGELIIVFSGSAVFPEGSYTVSGSTINMVDTLIDLIKSYDTEYRILIEGHADKNESLLGGGMNHWSLSAARAATIIARFEYYGFKSEYMVALAKGDREPVAEYKLKAGEGVPPKEISKLNRRAVVRVLEPLSNKKLNPRMGTLFKEAAGEPAASDISLFQETE